jgi:ABC-type antimicrobial peptide transport system permease subunit
MRRSPIFSASVIFTIALTVGALYYPLALRLWPLMDVVIRGGESPETLLPAVQRKVHELDPELALANVKTMDQWLSINAAQPRLDAILLGSFAAAALLIAMLGVYGVLSYSVNQRTREIGLRIALGAAPHGVLRLIVIEGMKVVFAGILVGLIAALMLGQALSKLVFGVAARDAATFAAVAVILMSVGLAACFIPGRRASRVDPILALRHE